MNIKELRAKTEEELKKLLTETRQNLHALNMERMSRKLKNVSQISRARHMVARILTILKEKEEKPLK